MTKCRNGASSSSVRDAPDTMARAVLVLYAVFWIVASATTSFGQTTTHLNPDDVVLDAERSRVNEARHEVVLVFRIRSAYRAQFDLAQFRKIVRPLAKYAACRVF